MGGLHAPGFAVGNAVEDRLHLALGQRRVAVACVPIVHESCDEGRVQADGAQKLSRNLRDG
jgi:hypothetical protein